MTHSLMPLRRPTRPPPPPPPRRRITTPPPADHDTGTTIPIDLGDILFEEDAGERAPRPG